MSESVTLKKSPRANLISLSKRGLGKKIMLFRATYVSLEGSKSLILSESKFFCQERDYTALLVY